MNHLCRISWGAVLFGIFLILSQASHADRPSWRNGVPLGTLTREECQKLFPYGRWIQTPLHPMKPELGTIEVFSFTVTPFDPGKKSVVYATGGPASFELPLSARALNEGWEDYNVVHFHIRGVGCSRVDPERFREFDAPELYFHTEFAAHDVEKIRNAYEIESWEAAQAGSYGVLLTHKYANLFPTSVKRLFQFNPSTSGVLLDPLLNDEIVIENLIGILSLLKKDHPAFWGASRREQLASLIWGEIEDLENPTEEEKGDYSETLQNALSRSMHLSARQQARFPILKRSFAYLYFLSKLDYLGRVAHRESLQRILNAGAVIMAGEHFPELFTSEALRQAERFILQFAASTDLRIPGRTRAEKEVLELQREWLLSGDALRHFQRGLHDPLMFQIYHSADVLNRFTTTPLHVPALVITGTGDASTPSALARYYASKQMECERMLVVGEGAGHLNFLPNRECKQAVNRLFIQGDYHQIAGLFEPGGLCDAGFPVHVHFKPSSSAPQAR